MNIQERAAEMDDRFTWKEDDLEIEDRVSSGRWIMIFESYMAQEEGSTNEQTDFVGRTSGDGKDHERI